MPGQIGGSLVFIPNNDLILMHVLLLASTLPATRLAWAFDGWTVVGRGLQDWTEISAVRGPNAFWLLRGLHFLARNLDAPVPPAVLEQLEQAVRRLGPFDWSNLVKRAARLRGRRALARHIARQSVLRTRLPRRARQKRV
jgi:hypothetical protein